MINTTEQSFPSAKETRINCHLANDDHGKTYYSNVLADVTTKEAECLTECYSHCKICWTDDECEPICSEEKQFKIEDFNDLQLSECQQPFYFCKRRLTKYEYIVNEDMYNEETRVKQFIGK